MVFRKTSYRYWYAFISMAACFALFLDRQPSHVSVSPGTWPGRKVAVLLESRLNPLLLPVIDVFATHLPLDWGIQLFLSSENEDKVRNACVLKDWINSGRILVSRSPLITEITQYNALLMSESFWRSIQGEHILFFQTDSVLCRSSAFTIDDFLDFDYVGAPWSMQLPWAQEFKGLCGNGGLSLRSKNMSLQVIASTPADPATNEDIWFCRGLLRLGARLPPRQIATRFAVETVYFHSPLGIHKLHRQRFNSSQLSTIFSNCPEGLMVPAP